MMIGKAHDDRQSSQAVARGAAQPSGAGGDGTSYSTTSVHYAASHQAGAITVVDPLFLQQHAANAHLQQQQAACHSLALYFAHVPTTPSKPLPTEIKAGELVAWRAWRVDSRTGMLTSMNMDDTWHPGVPMQGKPSDGSSGVHAWKTRMQAEAYAYGFAVIGEIELWGEVIEHEYGYRAEYGAIKSLVLSNSRSVDLNTVRRTYGLPEDYTVPHLTRRARISQHIVGLGIAFGGFATAILFSPTIPMLGLCYPLSGALLGYNLAALHTKLTR